MDITVEPGSSLDDEHHIVQVSPQTFVNYEDTIRDFLQQQPESYSYFYTLEEYVELIRNGLLVPWIYYINRQPIGLVLLSRHFYSPTVKTIKIEFVSCKQFFKMSRLMAVLEDRCREGGFTYIEAIAHPSLGKFSAMKLNFTVPGVYIRKAVAYDRRN